jgi:hypothetical protein
MYISKFVGADYILGSLHRVDVGSIAGISEMHAASIFRVEVFYTTHADVYVPHKDV